MKSLGRKLHKIFSIISGLSLIFNSLLLVSPVYAQTITPTDTPTETVAPTPTDTITPTDTTTPTPTDTLTPTPTGDILDGVSTESAQPSPTATAGEATPTETLTPTDTNTPTNTPDQSTPTPAPQSTATPTPTVTPTPTPEVNGHLEAAILKNANALSLDLSTTDISGSAVLTTNKPDYAPTDIVVVSGTGFIPKHDYTLEISSPDPPAVNFTTTITTDPQGSFIYSYQLDGNYRPNYSVTVKDGATIVATTTFTDANAAANLDQCANKGTPCDTAHPTQWQNGNLGQSQATYFEGDSVPYRMVFTNLSIGTHTVNIEWDTTQTGKHATDYLTTFNRTETTADPCAGVSPCSSPTTFAIPTDSNVTGLGVTPVAGNFTLYNGTITSVSAYTLSGTYAGSSSTSITLTFTVTNATSVLSWGGHIASRIDWGQGNAAINIPGSPYHMRLLDLDGKGGNQDRSLSADAVIYPASITIIKDATPNGSTSFGFTASPAPLANFSLVDDGTSANTKAFTNITNLVSYAVTESAIAGWTLGTVSCVVTSPNGGTQTQSSSTETINLKEGENVTCTFPNTKNQTAPTITTTIHNGVHNTVTTVPAGTTVHDSITVSGSSGTPTGNVSLNWYTNGTCNGTAADTSGNFALSGGTVDATSFTETPNTVGSYSFKAHYYGDTNYTAADGLCEPLTVTQLSPSISTKLSSSSITVGGSISDSSTLTGATSNAGGSVTYSVYTDSACSQNKQDAGTKTVTSGIVPDSNSITFNTAGDYYWQAVYSGDTNNAGATSTCTDEHLVVNKVRPSISTTLSASSVNIGDNVHDSASLTGATGNAGGTVTYHAYAGANTCSGTDLFGTSGNQKTVTGGVVSDSDNISFASAGTYSFQAVYSGDANNYGATSVCSTEQLVVNKNSPTIATALANETIAVDGSTNDTASLSDATANAGGTVTYSVYTDSACSQNKQDAGTKTVTSGIVPDSNSVTFNNAGDYYWQAIYSGDTNNNGATSECTSEHLVVNKAQPSIITNATASVTVGQNIKDTATISDLVNPDGTAKINFALYSDSSCKNQVTTSQSGFVTKNDNYDSSNYTTTAAGTYYWIASFPGDANNQSATTSCGDSNESSVVTKDTPTLTTTASGPVTVGQDIHDVAHLSGGYGTLGGSISFEVFAPGDTTCQTPTAVTPNQSVSGANDYTSGNYTTSAVGDYRWIAHYSGDSNNNKVDTSCNDSNESSATQKSTPEITTTLHNFDESVLASGGDANSDSVFDSANVTGGYNPTGDVTFRFYATQAACTSDTDFAGGTTKGTVNLVNGTASPSDAAADLTAGNYAFKAKYNGDDNNNPVVSSCEPFYVTTLTVDKTLIPSGDPGRFDLQIDGNAKASDVGDGGTTDPVIVASGSHTVAEVAGDDNTDLTNYTSSIDCTNDDSGSGTSLDTSITAGDAVTCTITNTRQTGKLIVHKIQDTNGDGTYDTLDSTDFTWGTNGTTFPYAMGGNGQTLNTGPYSVTESSVTGYQLTGWYNGKPQGGDGRYFCDTDNHTLPADVNVTNSEIPTEITICNQLQNPILTITKENNAGGPKSPGDSVLFTITVTATQSAAFNVQVTDLPAGGFTYRPGSWTANSNTRGDLKASLVTTEPTYHSPGVWNLGNMSVGETVTLTYIADIAGNEQPGTYYDLAWATGCKTNTTCSDVLANAVTPGFVADNYVGTQVPILVDQQNGVGINVVGQVLGASTELPATGADTFWLYIAFGLITGGLSIGALGWYVRRKYA